MLTYAQLSPRALRLRSVICCLNFLIIYKTVLNQYIKRVINIFGRKGIEFYSRARARA